jgi:hypothetical protein
MRVGGDSTGRCAAFETTLESRGRCVVAREGIEPPTPAFSGLRSTPELPGRCRQKPSLANGVFDYFSLLHLDILRLAGFVMGEKRLGDVIDDYCVKCRRLTNHSIVSLFENEAAKVRCRTCYHDHDYRREQAPPTKKELKKAEDAKAAALRNGEAGLEGDLVLTFQEDTGPAEAPKTEAGSA